jgi:hypothetical protein
MTTLEAKPIAFFFSPLSPLLGVGTPTVLLGVGVSMLLKVRLRGQEGQVANVPKRSFVLVHCVQAAAQRLTE